MIVSRLNLNAVSTLNNTRLQSKVTNITIVQVSTCIFGYSDRYRYYQVSRISVNLISEKYEKIECTVGGIS